MTVDACRRAVAQRALERISAIRPEFRDRNILLIAFSMRCTLVLLPAGLPFLPIALD